MILQGTVEFVSPIASMGVGGALAYAIFYFYRKDRERSEHEMRSISADFKQIIQENTKAVTKLGECLKNVTVCPYYHLQRDKELREELGD